MSEAKFTKGVFRVSIPDGSNGYWDVISSGEDHFSRSIATLYGDNAENDALLFAFAPDMYEEIEGDVLEISHELKNKDLTPHHRVNLLDKLAVKTKLLAKARGES